MTIEQYQSEIQNWKDYYHNHNSVDPAVFQFSLPNYPQSSSALYAQVFQLEHNQLVTLLTNSSSPSGYNNQLRLHLALKVSAGLVDGGTVPNFYFIADAFYADPGSHLTHPMGKLQENAIHLTFMANQMASHEKRSIGKRQIRYEDAIEMENAYVGLSKETASAFSNHFVAKAPVIKKVVKGFTVGSDDVNAITDSLGNSGGKSLHLFVHLGSLPEDIDLPDHDPYRFRPILQLGETLDDPNGTQQYFEFSHPCPPYCDRFQSAPMDNPFEQKNG